VVGAPPRVAGSPDFRKPEFRATQDRVSPLHLMQSRVQLIAAVVAMIALVSMCASGFPLKKKVISRTVTGIVLDKDDNPISGAVVEMTDEQTGKKLDSYTGDDGRYVFADRGAHRDYKLKATYKGESSEVRTASSFDDSNKIILNLRIPPEP
jgi:Carboxypeptidase regulatory-like domain